MDFNQGGVKMRHGILIFFFTAIIQVAAFSQGATLDGLVLVGNKTGLSSVSRKQLNGIFRGSQSIWKTNEQVTVVMPSSKAEYAEQFAGAVLQMSHAAVQKYWLALVFQGRANPPIFLNSSLEIVDYIKKNPGSIGVVKLSEREVPAAMLISISDRQK
jgi:ABC-type phosphate transport system substrate-binding protein